MGLKVNFNIAKTHLLSRVKQSLVAALGVTFGISMYIFLNSLISGVNELQEKMTLSTTPHVRIFNEAELYPRQTLAGQFFGATAVIRVSNVRSISYHQNLKNPQKLLHLFRQDAQVQAITPQVTASIFFQHNAIEENGVITGVDILSEDRMFDVRSSMREGKLEDLVKNPNGMLMGIGLARRLGIDYNDNVVVSSPGGIRKTLKEVGIFETTIASIDKSKAYASISTVQQLLQENQAYITDLKINLHDINAAATFAQKYAAITGYMAEDWKASNQQLSVASFLRDFVARSVVFTILIVAGFGIYNILNMTIYEKMKDIAILKATGYASRDVISIFLLQAILIGITGGLTGIGLGFLISYGVAQIRIDLGNVDTLPITFYLMTYLTAFLFGLLTTILAGYLPAKRASQVDPVQIIRG